MRCIIYLSLFIQNSGAIISGFFVLQVLFAPNDWTAHTIDIVVPNTSWTTFTRDFTQQFGATLMTSRDIYSSETIGYSEVKYYRHGETLFQAKRSTETPPTHTLTLAPTTLLMNYISHDHICVPYPHLTLRREGILLSTNTCHHLTILSCADRGFTIRQNRLHICGPPSPSPNNHVQAPALCPQERRTFHDQKCLILPLSHERPHLRANVGVYWVIGGYGCSPACRPYTPSHSGILTYSKDGSSHEQMAL